MIYWLLDAVILVFLGLVIAAGFVKQRNQRAVPEREETHGDE